MMNNQNKIFIFVSVFIITGIAIMARWWAAPLAAGPDMTQFLAFAKIFDSEGFRFYLRAGAEGPEFPYQAWSYNYTPLWATLLFLCLKLAPNSVGTTDFLSAEWRVAMKLPLYFADFCIGILIFRLVKGSPWRKLFFSALWFLHPTVWYESSVFGQFDCLMVLFLILGIYLLSKDRWQMAFFALAIAVLIKQHAAIVVLYVMLGLWKSWSWKERIGSNAILFGTGLMISAPFIVGSGITIYLKYLFVPASWVGYQGPLVYAFSGLGSLLTYIHSQSGVNTLGLMPAIKYLQIFLFLAGSVYVYKKKLNPLYSGLIGFLILFGFSILVNYQSLIGLIPFALLAAGETKSLLGKSGFLILALFPAIWMWTFDVGFWFRLMKPYSGEAQLILSWVGLTGRSFPIPDSFYVAYSLTLMLLIWFMLGFTVVTTRNPPPIQIPT